MADSYLFTSEQVTDGHPDSTADAISDNVLDAVLEQDPDAHVAAETLLAKGLVVVAGEITTEAYVDIESIVRKTILNIGFDNAEYGLDGNSVGVLSAVIAQSPEIAGGVATSLEARQGSTDPDDQQGAGDQGIFVGYANLDNKDYFPAPSKIASLLAERLSSYQKAHRDELLLPDGKTQVTLRYENGIPVAIDTILISTQHRRGTTVSDVTDYVKQNIIFPVLEQYNDEAFRSLDASTYKTIINPAGEWHIGSSAADTGLTSRKLASSTYGGMARWGGGGMCGKDLSKSDRFFPYALRWAAKNLVAAGAAEEIELQASSAIGQARPVSFMVDTKGRPSIGAKRIEEIVKQVFDFRPIPIIRTLELKRPIFRHTAAFGHFGRNPDNLFTWENLDKVEEIQALI